MHRRSISLGRFAATTALVGLLACTPLQAAFAVHHKPNKPSPRQVVEGLEEQWRQAQLDGDAGAMDRLLADDFVGITAFGQVTTKAQQLARVRDHVIALRKLELSDMKVKLIGNHVAIVTTRAELAGTSDGHPIEGTFRYTRVYQRLPGGTWKITSFEATRARRDNQALTPGNEEHPTHQ